MRTFFRFMRGEDGATLIEYSIIAALIAILCELNDIYSIVSRLLIGS